MRNVNYYVESILMDHAVDALHLRSYLLQFHMNPDIDGSIAGAPSIEIAHAILIEKIEKRICSGFRCPAE